MITAGEYRIKRIVAVWKDERDGRLSVLPPCGICRQFMRDIEEGNLDAEIILGRRKSARLKELIPAFEWPKPLDEER
jgi:cytidine deaminase